MILIKSGRKKHGILEQFSLYIFHQQYYQAFISVVFFSVLKMVPKLWAWNILGKMCPMASTFISIIYKFAEMASTTFVLFQILLVSFSISFWTCVYSNKLQWNILTSMKPELVRTVKSPRFALVHFAPVAQSAQKPAVALKHPMM